MAVFKIDSDVHKWPHFVMSLENCKACSQQISKKAKTCPHCGHKARRTGGCVKIIIIGFISFVALMIYSSSIVSKAIDTRDKASNTATGTEKNERPIDSDVADRVQRGLKINFLVKTEKKVRQSFKDPESVKFRDVVFGSSEETGDVIYGLVNAKNGLGAYTGFVKFLSNGKTTLIENQDERLDEAWLAVQQARITKEALKQLPEASKDVPIVLDVLSIVGKPSSQVAEIIGTPAEEVKTKYGNKKAYRDGQIEIVFIKGKADWITINGLGAVQYSPSALKAFGLDSKDPVYATTDTVMRWKELNGIKAVSLFKGKESFCDYLYVKVYTE